MPGACLRAAAALAWAAAIAVQPAPGQEPPAPRIGVALSGGAARGLAHIGVLEGLEELGVPIHVVSGTSMGALVGGFYAAGYDAHTLGALVRRVDWATVLSDRVDRRFLDPEQKLDDGRHLFTLPIRGWVPTLPDRLVSGHNVRQLVARLVWPVATVRDFRDLPLPFAAVATDLETGEAVVFASGNLADALSASMAIPGVFPPATLGGRLLVDGGLVRNLPARDARDLGAEVLICSDVTEPLKPAAEIATVLDVLSQAYRLLSVLAHAEDRAGCDVVIEPDLGGLTGSDFDQVDEWIARGRRAVEEVRDRLDALASREPHRSRPRPPAHPYVVDSVVTFGLEGPDARVARSRLGLTVPGPVTTDDLAAGLDRLYASGAYDQLGYRLDPRPGTDTARLVLRATRATPAELGFGIRYDQRYKASLLFTATLRDRLGAGSVAAVDLRAGEQARLAGSYTRRFGGVTPWLVGARLGYERLPFDLYDVGDRIGEARSYVIGGTLFVGRSLGTAVLAGVTATLEHARTAAAPAGPLAPDEELALVGAGATAVVDTRDRRRLPTRGVHVRARAEWARRDSGSSRGFAQHVVHAAAALPISGAVSLLGRVAAGASFGAALPEHHRFRLGGAVPYYLSPHRHVEFLGLRPHERSGRALQVVGAGAQVRLARDLHARLQWNGGAVLETWALDLDEWVHGAGVTLAAGIAGGLGSATLAAGAIEGPWRFDFEVGFPF